MRTSRLLYYSVAFAAYHDFLIPKILSVPPKLNLMFLFLFLIGCFLFVGRDTVRVGLVLKIGLALGLALGLDVRVWVGLGWASVTQHV